MNDDGEQLPQYNIPEILRRKQQLEEFFLSYYHVTLDAGDLASLMDRLQQFLPRCSRDALFESLRQITGQELLPARLSRLAWQLAGNLPALRSGRAITDWAIQFADEWVPVQVLRVEPALDQRQEFGFTLQLRVMAGSPCSQLITAFKKPRLLSAASSLFGFSAPWGKLPYRDARQLVSLRFFVKLEAARTESNELRFEKISCPSGCVTWNKRILKVRSRVEPCPRGFTHACHRCSIGYAECSAGTHRATYVMQACVVCGTEALFDPDLPSGQCVICHEKAAVQRQPR